MDNDLTELVAKGQNDEVLTTSKIVADNFGKKHKNVLQAIDSKLSSAENSAQYKKMFFKDSYKDKSGKSNRIYYMTRDGFSFIAMGFTGSKADTFKLKFIEAFDKMEQQLKDLSTPQIPQDLPTALRAYADQVEKSNRLLEENNAMQENYSFGTDLATSEDSEPVGNFAKQLKQKGIEIGQNKLFEWFRDNNYLMSAEGKRKNLPTQQAMKASLFEIKPYTYYDKNKVKHTKYTALITVKGQKYFLNKFLHDTK